MLGLYSGLYIEHLMLSFQIDKQGKKWIFKLESGLMHINVRDFVFQKAEGSAQW